MKITALTLLAALTALSLLAATPEEAHHASLKTAGSSMRPLRGAIEAKNNAEAAAIAGKVATAFAEVEKFWIKRKAEDAVGFARTAIASATEIKTAAEAGTDAMAAFSKLGGTCKGCHDSHREKLEDGTYKIK
jgi:cytochrome c556